VCLASFYFYVKFLKGGGGEGGGGRVVKENKESVRTPLGAVAQVGDNVRHYLRNKKNEKKKKKKREIMAVVLAARDMCRLKERKSHPRELHRYFEQIKYGSVPFRTLLLRIPPRAQSTVNFITFQSGFSFSSSKLAR